MLPPSRLKKNCFPFLNITGRIFNVIKSYIAGPSQFHCNYLAKKKNSRIINRVELLVTPPIDRLPALLYSTAWCIVVVCFFCVYGESIATTTCRAVQCRVERRCRAGLTSFCSLARPSKAGVDTIEDMCVCFYIPSFLLFICVGYKVFRNRIRLAMSLTKSFRKGGRQSRNRIGLIGLFLFSLSFPVDFVYRHEVDGSSTIALHTLESSSHVNAVRF